MRVIASVQAKLGSSRGLVHYIAHSKLDNEREPEKGRELFNAFTDNLSVKSANNSIKADIVRGRPSNEELHHLVLSFRPDDYRALGTNEKQRRRVLKDTTRAAMKQLENALGADRLSWAAAVHLNTENPHIHIAIQKEFLTRDIERRTMTKIPREALPHFELRDGEKVLVPGFLIEVATEKIDHIIVRNPEQMQAHDKDGIQHTPKPHSDSEKDRGMHTDSDRDPTAERDILRRGILAEYELRRIDARITVLTDHGDKMGFLMTDSEGGLRQRLSLRDLEQRGSVSDTDLAHSPERQIRTILFKMLAKEEAAKAQIQTDAGDTMREADRIRTAYRKDGRKLPVPTLTKDELDKLQGYCREATDIRRFSYLERIRSELERSREIEPRSKSDLDRIAVEKTISDLRAGLYEKNHSEFNDRRYYRLVDIGGKRISLAQLDREENAPRNPILSFVEKLKETALRVAGRGRSSTTENETARLRGDIVKKLDEQLAGIKKDQNAEQNKVQILEKIMIANPDKITTEPAPYSPEQLAEIETLSLRLKLEPIYEKNWGEQRALIESAGNKCPSYRKLSKTSSAVDFAEHKNSIIAGRALAKEIVARVEFENAKEDLKVFTDSKRFQKFGIADKKTGTVAFLSQHDVDLPSRGSLLDHAVNELFEGSEHRSLRRTVTSLVKDREQRLKDEVTAAKEIVASASRNASEFKQFSLFGMKSEAIYQPIFTSSEVTALEIRAANTRNPKEAGRLRGIVETATDRSLHSLPEILRNFENPEIISAKDKARDPIPQERLSRDRNTAFDDLSREPRAEERTFSNSHGHSR